MRRKKFHLLSSYKCFNPPCRWQTQVGQHNFLKLKYNQSTGYGIIQCSCLNIIKYDSPINQTGQPRIVKSESCESYKSYGTLFLKDFLAHFLFLCHFFSLNVQISNNMENQTGQAPLITDPPPTSFSTLYKKQKKLTCDT